MSTCRPRRKFVKSRTPSRLWSTEPLWAQVPPPTLWQRALTLFRPTPWGVAAITRLLWRRLTPMTPTTRAGGYHYRRHFRRHSRTTCWAWCLHNKTHRPLRTSRSQGGRLQLARVCWTLTAVTLRRWWHTTLGTGRILSSRRDVSLLMQTKIVIVSKTKMRSHVRPMQLVSSE